MKKYLPQAIITAVAVVGVVVLTGVFGMDMADPPQGGFILFGK